jgi:hypothetical protein
MQEFLARTRVEAEESLSFPSSCISGASTSAMQCKFLPSLGRLE